MGQGGHVILVNGTPYVWELVEDKCSNMEWEFKHQAPKVHPFTTCCVYVEVERTLLEKTSGYAIYQLSSTEHRFEIRADGYEVSAHFTGIETHNASSGEKKVLGSVSNRPCYFILSGTPGDFSSIGDVRDWMQKKLPRLGQRNLGQICAAASHDSGMNIASRLTIAAGPGSVITQVGSVEQQLQHGIRYFDIRPHFFEGKWVCGHYTYLNQVPGFEGWQGGNGASLESIIDGINKFTQSSKELIVLNLDEVRIIDGLKKFEDFRDLTADEWNQLLSFFGKIHDLWTPLPAHGPPEDIKLYQLPLQDFIGGGRAAVVVIANPKSELDVNVSKHKGCFRWSSWGFDSTHWQALEGERYEKLKEAKKSHPQTPYSYSGCHTQGQNEAILTTLHKLFTGIFAGGIPLEDPNSVVTLSRGIQEKVFRDLLPACSGDKTPIPNALGFDATDNSDMAALAMAFTDLAMS